MKKIYTITLVLIIIGMGLFFNIWPEMDRFINGVDVSPTPSNVLVPSAAPAIDGSATVTRVVDGDTIEVQLSSGESAKVRLIGINTPETVDPNRGKQCFGQEAADEVKKILNGQMVILEKDVSQTDKYDRLLRYVYLVLEDGNRLFVNDYLVRSGFAQVSTFPPDVKYTTRFLEAQRVAQSGRLGLWEKCEVLQ